MLGLCPHLCFDRSDLGVSLFHKPASPPLQLCRQLAELGDILPGGNNPFLFQPVRYIHRFDQVVMGLSNLINGNYGIVLNVSDGPIW